MNRGSLTYVWTVYNDNIQYLQYTSSSQACLARCDAYSRTVEDDCDNDFASATPVPDASSFVLNEDGVRRFRLSMPTSNDDRLI